MMDRANRISKRAYTRGFMGDGWYAVRMTRWFDQHVHSNQPLMAELESLGYHVNLHRLTPGMVEAIERHVFAAPDRRAGVAQVRGELEVLRLELSEVLRSVSTLLVRVDALRDGLDC